MPLLWPFSRAKNAQSFEKALTSLDKKIASCQTIQLSWSIRLRRVKGLVTLYSVLVYIGYNIYLLFGRVPWSLVNISGIVLAPVLIWSVRYCIQAIFNWVSNSNEEKYKSLLLEKEKIGEEIKENMNFYQAKAILDRFGLSHEEEGGKKQKDRAVTGGGDNVNSKLSSGDKQIGTEGSELGVGQDSFPAGSSIPLQGLPSLPGDGQSPPTPSQINGIAIRPPFVPYEPKWYDRILDLLVGEDEQSPNSRYALICANCRMHNGLCQFGDKPQFVVYYCPHCGLKNGKEEISNEKGNEKDIEKDKNDDKAHIDDEAASEKAVDSPRQSSPIKIPIETTVETPIKPKQTSPNPVRQRKSKSKE